MKTFKHYINEANLSIADLNKELYRWNNFKNKIETGDAFATTKGGSIVLDKSVLDGVIDPSDIKALTSKGKKVTWSQLEKTHEFGGGGGGADPTGAQWEALICVGVNKLKGLSDWNSGSEWSDVKHFWTNHQEASLLLAKDFIKKFKISELTQLGGATAATNNEWLGKDRTPKTDMINKKIHISLKKAGGSQLMSAGPAEALSTFHAALSTYSLSNVGDIHKLMNNIENDMGKMSTRGTITSIKAMRDSGKKLSKADKSKIAEMENFHKIAKDLTNQFDQIFKTNEFKNHFCFEAASGTVKFKPSPTAIATHIVVFDPLGKINNTLLLDSIDKAGSKLSKGNNFYVSFKGGSTYPYLTVRTKKVKIKESFADIVKDECSLGYLSEDVEQLNEFQLFDKLMSGVTNISNKIVNGAKKILKGILSRIKEAFNQLKQLGAKMMIGLIHFFGLDIKSVKVSGGGIYPL